MLRIHILEIDNRMLVRPCIKHRTKEGAAHAQDKLVGLEHLTAAGQRDVTQLFGSTQVLHHAEETGMVVVPLEQKLLLIHPVCCRSCLLMLVTDRRFPRLLLKKEVSF